LAAIEPPSIPQQHQDRPFFPTNNDAADPLSWLNGCVFFFKGQHTPNNINIGYEILHLIAQLQYMHLIENKVATNGELFAPCDNKYISPPNQEDLQEERL
jgi:hypothetical protein